MTSNYTNKLSIKAWAEADRPREKLTAKGRSALTDAELIAILLGSGSRTQTAVELARDILADAHNNLFELGRLSLKDLMAYKGIGEAKAISIAAALELGRRRTLQEPRKRPAVKSSQDAFALLVPLLADLDHEEFWVLFLNKQNKVLCEFQMSKGGVDGTVVDPKILFRKALDQKAVSMVLAHNHPSGSLHPSGADIALTRKLVEGGSVLGIQILDHLILADNAYYSFADEGKL